MNLAIIPAAGSGKRIGGAVPKQFLAIAGAPIIIHTLRRFAECADVDAIAVALPADEVESFSHKAQSFGLQKTLLCVSGGAERSDSILNALNAAAHLHPEVVAVHDAVRPFVTPEQISAVIARARETGAAIMALAATDTIKEVEHGLIVRTLDRRRIYRAQTPQAFRYELLRAANEAARAAGLSSAMQTDDAMLVERLGHPVAVIAGSPHNIKITTPEDLLLAERFLTEMI